MTNAEHRRLTHGRLKLLEAALHAGNVTRTCRHFGQIADYLQRFHGRSVACASVHRILRRHGMNRLPANQKYRRHTQRWTRYEKAQPGHRLQVDVKFLERIPGTRQRLLRPRRKAP